MKLKIVCGLITMVVLAACAPLKPNIQIGNTTGKIENNRWDYYDGRTVPYTSTQRSVTKTDLMTANEKTDMFQVNINAPKGSAQAVIIMNGETIRLSRFTDLEKKDHLFEKTKRHWQDRNSLNNSLYSDWYTSDDGKYYLIILESRQLVLTLYVDGDEGQSILYYPSRFLACKKIAMIKNEKDKAVVSQLLKTALVAGVQSYTNYATGTYSGSYGNFGYVTVRDYSWAGERAGEALGTLFSGQYSEEKITQVWNSLNCW